MKRLFTESPGLFRFSLTRLYDSIFGNTVMLVIYLSLCPPAFLKNPPMAFIIGVGLVGFGVGARAIFREQTKHFIKMDENSPEFLKNLPRLQLYFLMHVFGLALCFSFLNCVTIGYLGAYDKSTLFVYITVLALCINQMGTYAANQKVWLSFILVIVGIPTFYSLSLDPWHNCQISVGMLIGSYFFYRAGNASTKNTLSVVNERDHQKVQLDYFKSVIEAVPGLVTILDGEMRYRLVNSRVTKFAGYTSEALLGNVIGFARQNEFVQMVQNFYDSPMPHFQTRMQLTGLEGTRWFIVTMSRLATESQIAVVSMDIDDWMKAEQAALHQRAAAESSARLAAIGELASGIAHEINNPLAVITSKAEQTIRQLNSPGKTTQQDLIANLEKINETGFRIASIVKGLKNLSRNEQEDPFVEWKIKEIVDDVVSVFQAKLSARQIRMEIDIPDHLSMECHPTQIGQILVNLISNSSDAVRDKDDCWIRLQAKQIGDYIEISVTDSGQGIPQEIREKLMTPFFTTKAAGVGTGLGLSISRRIADDHQGEFYLDAKSGNTRFVLKIPKSRKQ